MDHGLKLKKSSFCNISPWQGVVPAGYFSDWLGIFNSTRYWKFPKEIVQIYEKERQIKTDYPLSNEHVLDYVPLCESIAKSDSFTGVFLGAGWGRWAAAAAKICQLLGKPCQVVSVEAEPTHYSWIQEHFKFNGLASETTHWIHKAASAQVGQTRFIISSEPAAWYGQAEQTPEICPGEGQEVITVETISLGELVKQYWDIDYIFMDIQGAELGFLEAGREFLNHCRTINIGTHSEVIEAGLKDLFNPSDWNLAYKVKINDLVDIEYEGKQSKVQFGDGVQVWENKNKK